MEPQGERSTRVVLAEDGDLLILVTDTQEWETKEFLVDSNTVRRSSKLWEALVADKSASSGVDVVRITRYKAEYLGIILSIMHCKFGDVPYSFHYPELYEFLQLTEEYEVTHLLRPWAATWVTLYQDSGFLSSFPRRRYTGHEDARGVTLDSMEIPFNNEHSLLVGGWGDVALLEDPEIPGLLGTAPDYVRGVQLEKLQQLHGVFEEAMRRCDEYNDLFRGSDRHPGEHYQDYDCCQCGKHHIWGQFCQLCTRSKDEQAMCNSMILGSIIRGYRQYKSYLTDECIISIGDEKEKNGSESIKPGGVKQSLKDHLYELRKIKIYGLPEATGHHTKPIYGKTHGGCNPTALIRTQLEGVLSDVAFLRKQDYGLEFRKRRDVKRYFDGSFRYQELANIVIDGHKFSLEGSPLLDDVMADDSLDEEVNFGTDVVKEDGDLLIVVRDIKDNNNSIESRHTFLVDSRVVSQSSPIWEALVPPKRDDSGRNVIEVTGDVWHHEKLFLLMHEKLCCSFDGYGEDASFNLLKFTDAWGVTYLILPWFTHWIDGLKYLNPDYTWLQEMDLETLLIRLWTVWTLGHREAFQSLTRFFVRRVNSDHKSELTFNDACLSEAFDKFGVPEIPGLIERENKLQELHSVFNEFMDSTYGRFCKLKSRSVDEQQKCDATIMGSIFLGRQRILTRIGSEKSLDETFRGMFRIPIYNLNIMQENKSNTLSRYQVHSPPSPSYQPHDECNPTRSLRNRLDMIMSSIATVLDKDYERALIKPVNIYGVPNEEYVLSAENESDIETDSDVTLPLVDEDQNSY
ncbi:hypothetical protein PG991_012315 [Apiospora marii]|uniref:Uncharacterized protein n=1 Tax=Apiospora marii TaxID=335849 RepID=A0ABR1R9D2_9PEZI